MKPLILLLLLGLPAVGLADSNPPSDPYVEISRQRFKMGVEAYERGDYATALSQFEAAKSAKPLPGFDYNIARCLERLQRPEEAIAAYQRYLDANPDPADAADARSRLVALRAEIAATAPTVSPTKSAPSPAENTLPPAISRSKLLFVSALAVGGLALVAGGTGVGLVAVARKDVHSLKETCAPRCDPASWRGAQHRETAGWAMLGVGLAAVAADMTLWEFYRRSVVVMPSPTGVALAGRF